MANRAFGKRKRKHSYEPHTTSKPTKSKKHRQRDFIAKNLDSATANKGIENEYADARQKNWIYLVGIVLGAVMTFFGIRDDGMEFKILGFKYSGALVGIAVILYCVYGMINNKPKVRIG